MIGYSECCYASSRAAQQNSGEFKNRSSKLAEWTSLTKCPVDKNVVKIQSRVQFQKNLLLVEDSEHQCVQFYQKLCTLAIHRNHRVCNILGKDIAASKGCRQEIGLQLLEASVWN